MIPVDLHCHSLFSLCGIHTHLELLGHARALGLQGLAITDHGPALGGRITSPFFDRLHDPVPGIRLLKGMESNVVDPAGRLDLPPRFLRYLDVLLLGLHDNVEQGRGPDYYTRLLVAAMDANPGLDIITHPTDLAFPVRYPDLAAAAQARGVALEINNSKAMLKRVPLEEMQALISACKAAGCRVAVNSDAHCLAEIGCDEAVRPLLAAANFPLELWINRTAAAAFAFIEERRPAKLGPGS